MQAWFVAAATVVGLVALTRLVQLALVNRLSALAERTTTSGDDLAVDLIRRIRLPFLVALYADLAIVSVMLPRDVRGFIHTAFIVACVYQAGVWGNGVIEYLIARRRTDPEYNGSTATTMAALGFAGKLILWSALVLLGLQNAGINVTALVTGLGIGGIAIALAVQNILGDLFASIAIVLDRPFVIGDFIIVGDLKGTVEHIGLKTTRLRSLFGEQLVISNEALLKQSIRNYRRMQERRITFSFGVTYQTPRARVATIAATVREVIEQQANVRFDRAHFLAFGDCALEFEAVYYVLSPEYNKYMDIQQAINLALMERFEQDQVDFAYPTRTLLLPGIADALRDAGAARDTAGAP